MKNLIITLLLLAISLTALSHDKIITQTHSEMATKVDYNYLEGMKKMGFKSKVSINSKGKLIYTFTKTITLK